MVCRQPLHLSGGKTGSRCAPLHARSVALGADPDIAAGSVLDRGQRLGAGRARRPPFGVDAFEPPAPVGPPRSLVLLRALEPVRKRHVPDIVVGPELVL